MAITGFDIVPEDEEVLGAVSFDDVGFHEAIMMLVSDPTYESARKYRAGDHYQGGDGWIGPHPGDDEDHAEEVWGEIEEVLVPHPALDEIVDRADDAIMANEPDWGLSLIRPLAEGEQPSEEEQALIDEAEALLTERWDDAEALEVYQQVVEDVHLGGRGVVQLLIPATELSTNDTGQTFVPDGGVDEQLRRIYPVFIPADQGVVIRDPLTMQKLGIYAYETVEPISGVVHRYVFLTYLDANGMTVQRTISLNHTDGTTPRTVLDLNRRLLMFEAKTKRLITEPVLRNQKLADLGCTMLGHNVIVGGFLERLILNGQVPGHWETDDATGKETFVEDPYKMGATTISWIEGKEIGSDEAGNPKIATPNVIFRQPTDTKTFENTINVAYHNILSAARQVYALISGDATASGESRIQARDDFEKSLRRAKSRIDAMGRWMLETMLKMAAVLAKDPERYDGLRVAFSCKLDLGQLSSEERKVNILEVEAELRSRDNAMQQIGIDDPQAEIEQITSENDTLDPTRAIDAQRAELGLAADQAALGLNPTIPGGTGAGAGGTGAGGTGGGTGNGNRPPKATDKGVNPVFAKLGA
jgi:hypothetical protein